MLPHEGTNCNDGCHMPNQGSRSRRLRLRLVIADDDDDISILRGRPGGNTILSDTKPIHQRIHGGGLGGEGCGF